jgi:general stress protein YciG
MSKQSDISKAAAALGKRGGQACTGKAKARSKKHYSEAGKKSGEVRRLRSEIAAADSHRFRAEDEKHQAVRAFYEMRGLHQRGRIGDCALAAAFRNAVAAASEGATQ